MAVGKTRVSRTGGDQTNNGEDQLDLGGDVALVGDPGDGATIVEGNETDDEKNWDLPEEARTTQRQPRTNGAANDRQDDNTEFDEEDSRLAYTESGDADADTPRGQSRRVRRNANRRAAERALQNDNAALRQQLDELTGTVTRLVTGQQGLAVNTLDGQYSTMQAQLRVVDQEMAEAVKTSDGDTYARAQRLRDELVGRMYALRSHRERMEVANPEDQQDRQPNGHANGGHVQQQQRQAPDPRVSNFFERFCDRFDWFDSASQDANSNIVRALDQELVSDGYQRNTPLFWQQLERRLSDDYGLRPNAAPTRETQGDDDDQQDERPARQQQVTERRNRPPTSGGRSASSGRASGFRLSDIQTNILREEGLLDDKLSDEDKAKRQRIIDKWKSGAQRERRGVMQ